MITYRVGTGFDIHRLAEGRKLILGGVEIPFEKGLAGHSDSDVLAHAVCDAMLGAAALGDIGTHFPDTDPRWSGVSSLRFIEHALALLEQEGYAISNVDAVVVTERPKLKPFIEAIRQNLAAVMRVDVDGVSVKAKTNEGLDAIGRGEAIAAHAVVAVYRETVE